MIKTSYICVYVVLHSPIQKLCWFLHKSKFLKTFILLFSKTGGSLYIWYKVSTIITISKRTRLTFRMDFLKRRLLSWNTRQNRRMSAVVTTSRQVELDECSAMKRKSNFKSSYLQHSINLWLLRHGSCWWQMASLVQQESLDLKTFDLIFWVI